MRTAISPSITAATLPKELDDSGSNVTAEPALDSLFLIRRLVQGAVRDESGNAAVETGPKLPENAVDHYYRQLAERGRKIAKLLVITTPEPPSFLDNVLD